MQQLKPFFTYFLIFSSFFVFVAVRWTRRRVGFRLPFVVSVGLLGLSFVGLNRLLAGSTGLVGKALFFRAYVLGGGLLGLAGALLGLEISPDRRGIGFYGLYGVCVLLFFITVPTDWRTTAILLYGIQSGATLLSALLVLSVPEEWLERMGA